MNGIFKFKKLSFVSLFLLCLFEPFFCVDILLLFDFVDQQVKVVKNDEAFEFIQCFLFPCVSWIYSLWGEGVVEGDKHTVHIICCG
jgi:hypothetical protein